MSEVITLRPAQAARPFRPEPPRPVASRLVQNLKDMLADDEACLSNLRSLGMFNEATMARRVATLRAAVALLGGQV